VIPLGVTYCSLHEFHFISCNSVDKFVFILSMPVLILVGGPVGGWEDGTGVDVRNIVWEVVV